MKPIPDSPAVNHYSFSTVSGLRRVCKDAIAEHNLLRDECLMRRRTLVTLAEAYNAGDQATVAQLLSDFKANELTEVPA